MLTYNDWMTKEEAIKRAGSQSDLARLLGISRGAVNQWKQLPRGRLYQLVVLKPEWFSGLLTNEQT
jgi:predicted transcriptional regulator